MKNKKHNLKKQLAMLLACLLTFSCTEQFETFPENPNIAGENSLVPPSFLLRQLLFVMARGSDVTEEPLQLLSRLNQFTTGLTFPLYGGSNEYNWTVTGVAYSQIRNLNQLDKAATNALGPNKNGYLALSKFIRAYTFIWMTQRLGDIPVQEAGLGLENLKPAFDTQKDVFAICLQLLEEANDELEAIANDASSPRIDGDIFYGNDLRKWRKAVNTFKLRVLISLSKRADDTPDLRIKQRFQEVLANTNKFPIFTGNADNLNFVFIPVFNRYPTQFLRLYADQTTVSSTILNITTSTNDPRTFIMATPAPAAIAAGKTIDDFSAYKGTENGRPQNILNQEAQTGIYSYINYIRYLQGPDIPAEPYIVIGYPEMCFNIAEAINRGWAQGNAAEHYMNGIKASLQFYGLNEGAPITIGDVIGRPYGQVSITLEPFLNHPEVVYKGNNAEGLEQILKQKYVSMWQNSGWEPFYNYRRTGIPAFSIGIGTNAQQRIPLRWQYPVREIANNAQNVNIALQRQFGGNDDLFGLMWILK